MRKENELPSSIEAEKAVLGSIILEPTLWDSLSIEIEENDFIASEHRLIFRGIKKLVDLGSQIDTVTLIESLSNDSELSSLSNFDKVAYVKNLVSETPGTANFANYTNIIKQSSSLRKLISTAADISSLAKEADTFESDSALSEAEDKLIKLRDSIERNSGPKLAKDLIKPVYDKIDETIRSDSDLVGISTGFRDLDKLTMGLQQGDLFIIAGRPSMGKTSLAMNIAENVAKEEDGCVLVFSLEMSSESLTSRMLASMAGISQQSFKSANLTDRQWEKTIQKAKKLESMNIHIDDKPNISPMEIRAKARRLAKQYRKDGGVKLVVVDYIQLMQMPGRTENRVNELSDISRSLKYLAKEVNAPVIVLSQLNRAVEQRPNKRPQMADLRDSGAIEQDADLIFMLYRDYLYTKDEDWKNVVELRLVKHRNGPTKDILLSFRDELTRFGDLAPEIMNSYAENRTAD